MPDELSPGLREHLIGARLAGAVATSPRSTLNNCAKLVAGDERYTFGLSLWRSASVRRAVDAVRDLFGGDPGGVEDPSGDGWIDPDATMRAIALHRRRIADAAAAGVRVLLATGHPTGLLNHYGAIARYLQAAGCKLLAPLDDTVVRRHEVSGEKRGIRFLDAVATVFDGGRLLHSHRSIYMGAMLDDLGGGLGDVDLVIADHGMAGAAIERGIPTLSIADVNDPADRVPRSGGSRGVTLSDAGRG